jgi:HlyD family secretion protein
MNISVIGRWLLGVMVIILMSGCNRSNHQRIQGYAEGEYVYIASPSASSLEKLDVARGDRVEAGVPLFALDSRPQKAARDEATHKLAQARALWDDLQKGRRPTEIESLEAQLKAANAALVLSEAEFVRQEELMKTRAGTAEDFDRARSVRNQDRHRVAQLEADLKTARLGSRDDQIAAAAADVQAKEAALAKAEWDLSQTKQSAPQAGLVFDTLFREGEWVPAGRPVVAMLPPSNMKVRAFVPETRIGSVQLGDKVNVLIDGTAPVVGKVSFISPQTEYTPPVIFSQESRDKLVFMIELRFEPDVAAKLHPGQPVDVELAR